MALLARAMTPLPLQPGWLESVSFSRSLLPSGTISRQAAHRTDLRLDQHRVHPVLGRLDRLECGSPWTEPGGRGRLIGVQVTITTRAEMLTVIEPVTGEVLAEHQLIGPGEVSLDDAHYDKPRPDRPSRAPRPRTQVEKDFCALGPAAEAFLVGAAAAGVSKLGTELADILALGAAHGEPALVAALERAVEFGRWRAGDIRSILATAGAAPTPRPAGQPLGEVLTLPTVPTRSLDAYKITNLDGDHR